MQNPKVGDRVVIISTKQTGVITQIDPSPVKNGINDDCWILIDGGEYSKRKALELNEIKNTEVSK